MTVFANYANYYDLLYRDKDYKAEANFIDELIQNHDPDTKSILELGCGTAIHAAILAELGYEVYGVDLSAEMLEKAKQRVSTLNPKVAAKLKFSQGDIRNVRVDQKFDTVISLFHVFSYQTTNQDLQAAFATAKAHLNPGGLLIFDTWYGPAVLSQRPAVRVKRLEDEKIQVTRIADPVMYPNENLVDVNYQVFIRDKASGSVDEVQETHKMRYLFKQEIDLIAQEMGLECKASGEWLTNKEAGFDTWGVYFVFRG
ncbi:class I SAM-dependent DNA methyltransferase [Limnofasciculus baicalensis]|uniref:Class I SAM-dependent methyltransferase n=1 Tax=Limnofasciculus baicalensis BBK-W-15 TaxID=2699891 RepID=A0AAE3GXD1_9CYAN|nr:class I SAM-dependent methyltransferase [Limnofasciculus baicalensis]MCP2731568.1 class I SAM-dependent methyltransferase [Limnofasciculus baicalensis BBK-W-15]